VDNANDAILSTVDTGLEGPVSPGYAAYVGTSMATPQVTGVISLMLAVNPTLSTARVLQLLQSTATNFPGGSTCSVAICGAGIVNAAAAVNATFNSISAAPTPTPAPTPAPTPVVSSTLPNKDYLPMIDR